MKIRFLDLSVKGDEIKTIIKKINNVLQHGQVILGPEVQEFERKIEKFYKVKKAIGISSGTDALYIALRALDIGLGDEVIRND